jgi:hypothetical protein
MKKLFVFLGVLTFVTQAHCLKIENESPDDIIIAISPRPNSENKNENNDFSQGFVAKLNSGAAVVLKDSQLGPKWGTKEGDNFTIGLVSSSLENSHVIPKVFHSGSNVRITNEYLKRFLRNK